MWRAGPRPCRCWARRVEERVRRRVVPCPALPSKPAAEEKNTNASRSRPAVSSSRWAAAAALAASTEASLAPSSRSSTPVVRDPRGVQDRGQRRPADCDPVEQPRPARAAAARRRRAPPPRSRPWPVRRPVPRRAGGARPGPAGQHHPARAAAGQPPGHVPADGPGPAGDQRRCRAAPTAPAGSRGQRRPRQPPPQDPGGPDRHLVFAAPGQHRTQPGRGPLVEDRRQVDQAAPAARVLQGRDPAQAPGLRLRRAGRRPRPGRHRPAGQHPQRRGHPGVAQRLHQRQRARPGPGHHGYRRPGVSASASRDTTPPAASGPAAWAGSAAWARGDQLRERRPARARRGRSRPRRPGSAGGQRPRAPAPRAPVREPASACGDAPRATSLTAAPAPGRPPAPRPPGTARRPSPTGPVPAAATPRARAAPRSSD